MVDPFTQFSVYHLVVVVAIVMLLIFRAISD